MANINFMDVFINWFPMLLLIGVWVFFLRQMRGGGSKYQRDCMELMRRQAEAVEQIAVALEKR